MLKLHSNYLFIPLLLGLQTCGDGQGRLPKAPQEDELVFLDPQELLSLTNTPCREERPDTYDAAIFLWMNGALQETKVPKTQSLNLSPLSSNAVLRVMEGAVFRKDCDAKQLSPPECLDSSGESPRWSIIDQGHSLSLCKNSQDPQRLSAEAQALAATFIWTKATQQVQDLLIDAPTLGPVVILPWAQLESRWRPWTSQNRSGAYQSLETNNLYYFPASPGGVAYLAISPHTKSYALPAYFWESPFIITHEFGHHLENAILGDKKARKPSLIANAISEGFSDVVSFSLGLEGERALENLPCWDQDRSPKSPQYSGGIPKILYEHLLTETPIRKKHTSEFLEILNCKTVSIKSAHGIGAIFAHALFKINQIIIPGVPFHAKSLLTLAVHWLKTAKSYGIYENTYTIKQDANLAVHALMEAAKLASKDSPLTEDQKKSLQNLMNDLFPAGTSSSEP